MEVDGSARNMLRQKKHRRESHKEGLSLQSLLLRKSSRVQHVVTALIARLQPQRLPMHLRHQHRLHLYSLEPTRAKIPLSAVLSQQIPAQVIGMVAVNKQRRKRNFPANRNKQQVYLSRLNRVHRNSLLPRSSKRLRVAVLRHLQHPIMTARAAMGKIDSAGKSSRLLLHLQQR